MTKAALLGKQPLLAKLQAAGGLWDIASHMRAVTPCGKAAPLESAMAYYAGLMEGWLQACQYIQDLTDTKEPPKKEPNRPYSQPQFPTQPEANQPPPKK